MIFIEILEATIKLGLPVFVISWFALRRRYKKGDIAPGADRQTVKSNLKDFRKEWRKNKKSEYHLLENKWMRFGGGFYGITALITLLVIELEEVVSFFANISTMGEMFSDGLIGFLVGIFMSQLENFISALVWFGYWADGDRSILIWIGVPYASYLLAINRAAKYADVPGPGIEDDIQPKVEPEKVEPEKVEPEEDDR
jgi:hypothetical protein